MDKMMFKEVEEIIKNAPNAIISSVDEDGYPNTKAMLPPRLREGVKFIYFSTNTSSVRVQQYMSNSKACIYFYDNQLFRGVMLKGTMEVIHDENLKKVIWRDGDDVYYPEGVTDPDYCVLRFQAKSIRYYRSTCSLDLEVE